MRMKRSQLKALIKECLVEILQEDVLLQRATNGAMQEARQAAPQQQLMVQQNSGYINPMDINALSARDQYLMQQNAHRSTLQRQSQMMNGGGRSNDLAALAGLDDPYGASSPTSKSSYDRVDHGYRDPTSYLSLAQQRPPHFDPMLDTPVAGSPQAQRQRFVPNQHQHQHQHQPAPQQLRESDQYIPSPDVLRSIYDDTARTTMREQASSGHRHPGHVENVFNGGMDALGAGDRYDQIASQHDPTELFPGNAQNWAMLAFDK